MSKRQHVKIGFVGLVTAALAGSTLAVAPAQAHETAAKQGNRSLAKVLAADSGFDRNWRDFDIVEQAVLAVLEAKPDSAVGVLAKGRTRATAFIPTDAAFRRLVRDLTGKAPRTERATFRTIANNFDIDTIESVLLYHVVPGKTLGAKKVVARKGKAVKTALGPAIRIQVRKGGKVFLADQDRNDANPRVVALNINRGNKQIAHGINRVLRPIDL